MQIREAVSFDPGAATSRYERLARKPNLSGRVAEVMLSEITGGKLRPGTPLPSTRALSEQFGVSRTVVREALRELATRGVIEIRQGLSARVARVEQSSVSESMSLYLRANGQLDYVKLTEMRRILEVEVAALAAERATPADLLALHGVCEHLAEALTDIPRAALADLEFHRAIARCTHNEVFLLVLDSITDQLLDLRRRSLAVPGQPARTLASHRALLAQIEKGRPEGARTAMRNHLDDAGIDWQTLTPKPRPK